MKPGTMIAYIFITILICLAVPLPARADGGLIVPYDIWTNLKEGQQVAVVTILNQDRARVDLFISILDKTDTSHEIVFFVPVGAETSNFLAAEKPLHEFNLRTTMNLDKTIRDNATRKQRSVQILFSGALLTNGALLVPLWTPVLLAGCGAAEPQPEVTLETESSQISVFGIDETTDLDALIRTTGLPPLVVDTLSRLRGQQIAVVRLRTQPGGQGDGGPGTGGQAGEPGLHLSWQTALLATASGKSYSYPLGTGASWSTPIELTRVYVIAPWGIDFDIEYPKLGSDQSGYDIIRGAKILQYPQIPSYAVDEARGEFGRVWRASYTMSNSSEDIVITARSQSAYSRFLARAGESSLATSLVFALVVGLAVWICAWVFLMPCFLGKKPGHLNWYEALIYPGVNILLMLFPGSILYIFFLVGWSATSLLGVLLILGGAAIGAFAMYHARHLDVSTGRAFRAFVLTSLCGSAVYLSLALVFAKIINLI